MFNRTQSITAMCWLKLKYDSAHCVQLQTDPRRVLLSDITLLLTITIARSTLTASKCNLQVSNNRRQMHVIDKEKTCSTVKKNSTE